MQQPVHDGVPDGISGTFSARKLRGNHQQCPVNMLYEKQPGGICPFPRLDGVLYDRPAGQNEHSVSAMLFISGHQARKMLDRYHIVKEDDLRDAMIKTTQKASFPHNSGAIHLHRQAKRERSQCVKIH
jgi:hypothetical protein